jgi:hypothetical protein
MLEQQLKNEPNGSLRNANFVALGGFGQDLINSEILPLLWSIIHRPTSNYSSPQFLPTCTSTAKRTPKLG